MYSESTIPRAYRPKALDNTNYLWCKPFQFQLIIAQDWSISVFWQHPSNLALHFAVLTSNQASQQYTLGMSSSQLIYLVLKFNSSSFSKLIPKRTDFFSQLNQQIVSKLTLRWSSVVTLSDSSIYSLIVKLLCNA